MKRVNNLYDKICSELGLMFAENNAAQNKGHREEVKQYRANAELLRAELLEKLRNMEYKTSPYTTFKVYEPKERLIYKLPFYPDRIVHHAIMYDLRPIWDKLFIKNTYACIRKRGIKRLVEDLKYDLRTHRTETDYCLKMDVRKFYPSVNHDILKSIIRKKIKDKRVLQLLDEIIDSEKGVPIGNYLSQYFANLYLTYFDHWVKEELKCKFYYRYADDIVILHNDKRFLHNVLCAIKLYLKHELKLELKPNYSITPVEKCGIDYVGYVFRHNYVLLRKSIKQRIKKTIRKNKENLKDSMASYKGWLKIGDCRHLALILSEKSGVSLNLWKGEERHISLVYGTIIKLIHITLRKKGFELLYVYKGKHYYSISKNHLLFKHLLTYHNNSTVYIPYIGIGKKFLKR